MQRTGWALAAMLGNFVSEPFFSEMRTRQQLGYAVGSAMIELEDNLYMRFIIQSADYPADELQRSSTTWDWQVAVETSSATTHLA